MVHYYSIRFLQSKINRIISRDRLPLVVNQKITVVESASSGMNLKPKSHANIRPWRIAHNAAILLEANANIRPWRIAHNAAILLEAKAQA